MRQVSEPEKNPEHASNAASATNSQPIGISSVTASAALQDQLEHDLGTHIREQQRDESGERPVHRLPSAPSAEVMAPQQSPEDEPRDEGEHRLVVGLEGLAEELLGEEDAAHHGGRE